MKYSIDKQENYTIFELGEENLNSLIAPSLKSEFVILKNEGIKNLILNLTPVKYVDSSGLSAILTANRLWSTDGAFVLTGIVHDSVKKLIEISRLRSVINVIDSLEDSVALVNEAENEEGVGAADSDSE